MSKAVTRPPKALFELPAFNKKLVDELAAVGADYQIGEMAREFAILRLCRLIIEDLYRGVEIPDEVHGGRVSFPTEAALIDYVRKRYNISRSTIFSRLKGYRVLMQGLGRDYVTAFKVMTNAPGIMNRLKEVASFDKQGQLVTVNPSKALALPSADPDYTEKLQTEADPDKQKEMVRDALGELVEDAALLENRFEANEMVEHRLGRNSVKFRHNGTGSLTAVCTERTVTPDGEIVESPPFMVEWQPSALVPDWVAAKLYDRTDAIEVEVEA